MIEKHIDIATADGRMDSFVVHPEEGGPFPAVLILMDIWGLREELYDVARKVEAVGYHVTVPNFWYWRGKVRLEYSDEKGRMKSLVAIPQAAQDEMHANMSHLTDGMAMADIGAVLKFLDGEPAGKGPKGSIGYCLGGRLSLAAAAAFPEQFRASASMHGTHLVNDKPDSPHRFVDKMRGEIYCGFAERTHSRRPRQSRRWCDCSRIKPACAIAPSSIPAPCTAMRCRTATFSLKPQPIASRCSSGSWARNLSTSFRGARRRSGTHSPQRYIISPGVMDSGSPLRVVRNDAGKVRTPSARAWEGNAAHAARSGSPADRRCRRPG
jgi:carboxymethylenebutenolidase